MQRESRLNFSIKFLLVLVIYNSVRIVIYLSHLELHGDEEHTHFYEDTRIKDLSLYTILYIMLISVLWKFKKTAIENFDLAMGLLTFIIITLPIFQILEIV